MYPWNAYQHCHYRCKQRYHKIIEYSDYQTLNDMIRFNVDCKLIETDMGSNIYEIEYDNYPDYTIFYVGWDIKQKHISTFLPPKQLYLQRIKENILKKRK
jgi:hypothetical protein